MEHFGHFSPAVLEAIYSLCFLIMTLFCYISNLHFKTFFQLAFIPVLNKQLYDEEQANQLQSDRWSEKDYLFIKAVNIHKC